MLGRQIASVRALPRETALMLVSQFFSSLPLGLLLVFFPLYLHDLGLKSLLIGAVFTLAGIGSSLLLIVIGPLADRFGRRAFLLIGMAAPMLGFLIFAASTNTAWLIVASMLGGVGFSGGLGGGLVTATFNPILAGTVPPRLRTAVMALNECCWVAAIGAGALLAGLPTVLAHAHVASLLTADRAMFIGCLVATATATLILLPVHDRREVEVDACTDLENASPARAARGAPSVEPLRPHLSLILKLAVFFSLQGAGLGVAVQLLPLWLTLRFHTNAESISPWFAAAQVAGLPVILLVPWLARRVRIAGAILLVSAASTILLAGVPFMPALWLACTLFVLRSMLVSMQWPAQHSFLQGAVPPGLRGAATSIAIGCWSVANALLPSLGGWLLDRKLLLWPPVLGTVFYALSVLWFALTLRAIRLPEETHAEAAG